MTLVLIVEDNPEVAELLHDALIQAGHLPRLAANPEAAITILEAMPVDLVVTDLVMPGGGGVLVQEKSAALGIPTLIITGDLRKIVEFQGKGAGFLAKPFRMVEFVAAVAAVLKRRPAENA